MKKLLAAWIAANVFGWGIAFICIVWLAGGWMYFVVSWSVSNASVYGLIMGIIVGVLQGIALRNYASPINWEVLCLAGWWVALFLAEFLSVSVFLIGVLPMSLIAVGQALSLRIKGIGIVWWCAATVLGWSIGWFVGSYVSYILGDFEFYWVTGVLAGLIYGILSALVIRFHVVTMPHRKT